MCASFETICRQFRNQNPSNSEFQYPTENKVKVKPIFSAGLHFQLPIRCRVLSQFYNTYTVLRAVNYSEILVQREVYYPFSSTLKKNAQPAQELLRTLLPFPSPTRSLSFLSLYLFIFLYLHTRIFDALKNISTPTIFRWTHSHFPRRFCCHSNTLIATTRFCTS